MANSGDNAQRIALEQRGQDPDQRMFSPSAARNLVPILEVMTRILPAHGTDLEIGCGTGEHAACIAEAKPHTDAKRSGSAIACKYYELV